MSYFVKSDESTIIVVFSGVLLADKVKFDFFKTITDIPNCSKLFFADTKSLSYHHGIDGISTNIDETVDFLRAKLNGFSKTIFTGISAGGYAAILFGSLLNVSRVISFRAPTLIKHPKTEEHYRDLSLHINNSTIYQLYYDPNISEFDKYHHISNYFRVEGKPNVMLFKANLNMRKLVEDGDALEIFTKAISN